MAQQILLSLSQYNARHRSRGAPPSLRVDFAALVLRYTNRVLHIALEQSRTALVSISPVVTTFFKRFAISSRALKPNTRFLFSVIKYVLTTSDERLYCSTSMLVPSCCKRSAAYCRAAGGAVYCGRRIRSVVWDPASKIFLCTFNSCCSYGI